MRRAYRFVLQHHLRHHQQMIFLAGPRQVGKTTLANRILADHASQGVYLNWDVIEHRERLLAGATALIQSVNAQRALGEAKPLVILDEIHKYKDWKNYLKGLYDLAKNDIHLLVTGSSRLDIFRKGGDSLMGRYLLYQLFPLSVREIIDDRELIDTTSTQWAPPLLRAPTPIDTTEFQQLIEFGGFPDPYIKGDPLFHTQWTQLRHDQLFREDIVSLSAVSELQQLEMLAHILQRQSGQQVNYSKLAKQIRMDNRTIRRWFDLLESAYFCFRIQPWSKNIARSLLKEPKVYGWDWSTIQDAGQRHETLVACHLHKATRFWTDCGLGRFGLYYLRDKNQREVDFMVTRDDTPWFMVEVKTSKTTLSPHLSHFQNQSECPHAFQVTIEQPFHDEDCFSTNKPTIVSAASFLSQLI